MELSRDDFVRLLVEQLEQNASDLALEEQSLEAALDCDSAQNVGSMVGQVAMKAFRELGFDFPTVTEQQVEALDAVLKETLKKEAVVFPKWFWMNPKVVEGVQFCLFERAVNAQRMVSALSSLNATLLLRIPEAVLSSKVNSGDRQRLFHNPSASAPATLEKLWQALNKHIQLVSYQALSTLDLEQWEDAHISATIYRLVRSILSVNEDGARKMFLENPTVECVLWVAELQAGWPRLLFVLRDRLTDKPESMNSTLPALVDVASLCHTHHDVSKGSSNIGNRTGMTSNPVLIGVLSSIVTSKTFQSSSTQQRGYLWDLIAQNVVSSAGTEIEHILRIPSGGVEEEEVIGPGREEHLAHLLALLDYFGKGDPRKSFSSKGATEKFVSLGIIRTVSQAWVHGREDMPLVLPQVSLLNTPEEIDNQNVRAQVFLFNCCMRSKEVCDFLVRTPGFCARICAKVSDVDKLSWCLVIVCSLQTSFSSKKGELFTPMTQQDSGIIPSFQYLESQAVSLLGHLAQEPFDKVKLKLIVDLIERLEQPEFVRLLHFADLRPVVINSLKSAMHSVGKLYSIGPSDEDAHSEQSVGKEKDDDLLLRDRASRLKQHVKRFLCLVEDQGNKAD